jgi:hypothetical protein
MERITLKLSDDAEARALDQLVARFTEELSLKTDECVFYLTQPGADRPARIVETESAETLEAFVAFVSPHLSFDTA